MQREIQPQPGVLPVCIVQRGVESHPHEVHREGHQHGRHGDGVDARRTGLDVVAHSAAGAGCRPGDHITRDHEEGVDSVFGGPMPMRSDSLRGQPEPARVAHKDHRCRQHSAQVHPH